MSQSNNKLIFPELLCFLDFGGDFDSFFQEAYRTFKSDFIKNHPQYNSKNVSAKRYPEEDGMHRTFYHITHEGSDESNRLPDTRRLERIRYPKFIIDNNKHEDILIWENTRGRDKRVLFYNKEETYLVVLTERKKYYLLTTAYLVDKEHTKRKLMKEYNEYIKTKTA